MPELHLLKHLSSEKKLMENLKTHFKKLCLHSGKCQIVDHFIPVETSKHILSIRFHLA